MVVTPHRDVDAVEAALAARDEERAVVVTDSVFSADGALAPLRQLHDVCRRHGAVLLVDEAHGLGVRGTGGRGLLDEVGLAGAPDVVMTTTLSKALGSQGGVVLGSVAVRDHLIDAARTFIFDTGLAPAAVGSAAAALRLLIAEPGRADAVLAHARALADICGVTERPESAVVSVILGDPEVALAAANACLERGVRVGCFRPPTVPAGTSRLRLTARASLTAEDLALARRVLTEVLARPGREHCRRHRHRNRSGQDGRHRGAGLSRPTGGHRRRGVQAGADRDRHDGDDDLAEVGRLSGVTELVGLARYPQPLAPVAAASAAGMALPTRAELLEVIRGADRPGRLTLVEGAGGLLVELGADGVTLRDLAVDLGAPVIVVVRTRTRHAQPHRADDGSPCCQRAFRVPD